MGNNILNILDSSDSTEQSADYNENMNENLEGTNFSGNSDGDTVSDESFEESILESVAEDVSSCNSVDNQLQDTVDTSVVISEDTILGTKICSDLSLLKEEIAALSLQFESKIKYDKHKEEIIDKLHAENQLLKNDLYKKFVLPFINELIILIDDYSLLHKKHSESDLSQLDVPKLLSQFGSISSDLENVLDKNGIEAFHIEDDKFDPSRQKIIKIVPTDDPAKDKTICERLKKGFILDGKIIRMEHISCFKFTEDNI